MFVNALAKRCAWPRHTVAGAKLQSSCVPTALYWCRLHMSSNSSGNDGEKGKSNAPCLASVPYDTLTQESLPIFYTYALGRSADGKPHVALSPGTSSSVVVISNEDSFNALIREIFTRDVTGADGFVQSLRQTFHQQRTELAPMLVEKHRVDDYIENFYSPLLRCITFILLLSQFLLLLHWTFVVFDWNLVEPMTYFIAYSAVWVGMVLYCYTARQFTWDALLAVLARRRRHGLYARAGISADAMERQKWRLKKIDSLLARY
ncbi:putative Mitochondrial calcium uniporter [Trypanosoma vivax]|uniref:Calcium uniporter protein C-terminal domain-containing protein n=1 Tax=Trypanosoma vivax (strain Y486) TaxID=1055687 RepID=G0UAW2_TRYVY|nr:hypothetical protein TRVL_00974 [Trypanosoma vivax]KAH8611315.1 putative Mitochondrial calcium uniporter [Trypanosoma vivax]CCC52949.1 conserved hypothetical protein [Trypanosoma vivax Y486]